MKFVKKNLFAIIAAVLVVVSICLLFGDCVNSYSKVGSSKIDLTTATGFDVIFGYTYKKGAVSVELLGFSFLNFLAIILAVAGAVLAFLNIPFKSYIAGGVLVVAGILLMLMGVLANVPKDAAKLYSIETIALGYVSGILTIIAGLLTIVKPFIIKK